MSESCKTSHVFSEYFLKIIGRKGISGYELKNHLDIDKLKRDKRLYFILSILMQVR